MKLKSTHIFLLICASFIIYSISIYIKPLNIKEHNGFDKEKASNGRIVWQNYNCQSCHQLYGLGGYLGTDLTNIMSDPKKGEIVFKSILKYGTKQMPAFKLSETEMIYLIEFLKSVDASGKADPRNFKSDNFGMIKRK